MKNKIKIDGNKIKITPNRKVKYTPEELQNMLKMKRSGSSKTKNKKKIIHRKRKYKF